MATTVEIGGVLGHAEAMSTREEVLLILGSTLEVSVSATSPHPKSQTRNKEKCRSPRLFENKYVFARYESSYRQRHESRV